MPCSLMSLRANRIRNCGEGGNLEAKRNVWRVYLKPIVARRKTKLESAYKNQRSLTDGAANNVQVLKCHLDSSVATGVQQCYQQDGSVTRSYYAFITVSR
jgi:hypothetical protein